LILSVALAWPPVPPLVEVMLVVELVIIPGMAPVVSRPALAKQLEFGGIIASVKPIAVNPRNPPLQLPAKFVATRPDGKL